MEQKESKKPSFFTKYLTKTVIKWTAIILVIGSIGIGIGSKMFSDNKTTALGFENIGELATQAAYCTEVNVTSASKTLWDIEIPFTQSKYIYSYDVIIKAGVDFKEIEWSEKNKVIEVKLPQSKILNCEIDTDSLEVYYESQSIFTPIPLTENNEALKQLKENAKKDAIANGLLENANKNAELILTGFFASEYDLKEYEIKFLYK